MDIFLKNKQAAKACQTKQNQQSVNNQISHNMNKVIFKIFLTAFFFLTSFNQAFAEIIDIQNEEKTFGDWKVFCETDVMMNISNCKVASKFYENNAVITIEGNKEFLTHLFLVIPQIKIGSPVTIRIDTNDLITTQNVAAKDFGSVPLEESQKNIIYNQMKSGNFLFMRFGVRGSEKEITAKINLKDFRNALSYSNNRTSK